MSTPESKSGRVGEDWVKGRITPAVLMTRSSYSVVTEPNAVRSVKFGRFPAYCFKFGFLLCLDLHTQSRSFDYNMIDLSSLEQVILEKKKLMIIKLIKRIAGAYII